MIFNTENAFSAKDCSTEKIVGAINASDTLLLKSCFELKKIDFNTWQTKGDSVLHVAVFSERISVLNFLLKYDLNLKSINKKQQTALDVALLSGQDEASTMLISAYEKQPQKPDLDFLKIKDILFLIAEKNMYLTLDHIKRYLTKSDLNKKNESGDSALHVAAANGSVEVIRILLQAGADPQLKNINNETSLDIAKKLKLKKTIQALSKIQK